MHQLESLVGDSSHSLIKLESLGVRSSVGNQISVNYFVKST